MPIQSDAARPDEGAPPLAGEPADTSPLSPPAHGVGAEAEARAGGAAPGGVRTTCEGFAARVEQVGAARPTGDFLDGLEAGIALVAELLDEFEAARAGARGDVERARRLHAGAGVRAAPAGGRWRRSTSTPLYVDAARAGRSRRKLRRLPGNVRPHV